ncbi:MAG: hypothetical protein Q9183_007812 [Haloplaca sp. 2 TL-2023]
MWRLYPRLSLEKAIPLTGTESQDSRGHEGKKNDAWVGMVRVTLNENIGPDFFAWIVYCALLEPMEERKYFVPEGEEPGNKLDGLGSQHQRMGSKMETTSVEGAPKPIDDAVGEEGRADPEDEGGDDDIGSVFFKNLRADETGIKY